MRSLWRGGSGGVGGGLWGGGGGLRMIMKKKKKRKRIPDYFDRGVYSLGHWGKQVSLLSIVHKSPGCSDLLLGMN